MLDYPALSDPELHSLYLSGDAEAGNTLVLRYRRLVKTCTRPFFLAGGLNTENVEEAVRLLHPYAVDVSSGVETDGHKDEEKVRQLISRVREMDV